MKDVVLPMEMARKLAEFFHIGQSLAKEIVEARHNIVFDENAPFSDEIKALIIDVSKSADEAVQKAFRPKAEKLLELGRQINLMRPHDTEKLIMPTQGEGEA